MTRLALKNPIAILMICIGLVVFAAVVTPRMSVDTFPELTPPVLVVGTLAPGPRARRTSRRRITWRIEKYVSATPGVDHVESTSRNNLSRSSSSGSSGAPTSTRRRRWCSSRSRSRCRRCPKSLGVLPPFVLQYDPSNAPVVQVAVSGGGLTGPQLYDYALNNIEPILEGIPGVASASLNGGRQRQINVVVDPVARPGARRHLDATSPRPSRSRTRSCRRASSSRRSSTPTSTRTRSPGASRTSATRSSSCATATPVLIQRRRARRGRRLAGDAGRRRQRQGRRLPQRAARPGRQHARDRRRGQEGGRASSRTCRPGCEVKPIFDQSTFVRTSYDGLKKEIVQALDPDRARHPAVPAERARHADRRRSRSRSRSRSSSSSSTRPARR